jgi:uncharacterized small protein (DUF1192 family)
MDITEKWIADVECKLAELEDRLGEHILCDENSSKLQDERIIPLENFYNLDMTVWEQRLQTLEGRLNKLSPELNYKELTTRITAWGKEIEKLEAKLDVVHKLAERIACLEEKIPVRLINDIGVFTELYKEVHFRTAIKYLFLLVVGQREKAKEYIENV